MTHIYVEKEDSHKDYMTKSAMRTEISTSEREARRAWAVASRDVGMDESL